MSKKHKFDLSHIVHSKLLKEGDKLYFVSDPKLYCTVVKHPGGEYKVEFQGEMMTLHQCAHKCIGMDPPDHASKWFRTESGKSVFELWELDTEIRKAS
jgi:hypothetical protein